MGQESKLNDQQRREEMAAAQRSFAQALAAGERGAQPIDRFMVPIVPGSRVLYRPSVDMIFEVEDVKPVLDPRMGPGFVTIVLTVRAPITVNVRMPTANMIAIQGRPDQGSETPDGTPPPPPDGD